MSKKSMIPTPASIRKAYVEEYLKRRPDAEEFARFTESELADFIRKHESPNFESIYTQLDHNYYDRVRHDMAIDGQMRTEDNAADNRYSLHLKTWSGFLESKAFRNLFKTKIAIEDLSSDAEPSFEPRLNDVYLLFKNYKSSPFWTAFIVLKCRVCEIFRTFRFSRFLHVSFFKSSTFRFAGFIC